MKKIFILKGVANTGKTTKINQIAEWIINTYSVANTIGLDVTDLEINTWGILTIGKLKIGFNSAGDNDNEIKKIDKLVSQFDNDIDIIICACRTKGPTYQHLYKNYIRTKGWLDTYINIEEYNPSDLINQSARDARVFNELKVWLTGLEKL
jgi:hypothetical protein